MREDKIHERLSWLEEIKDSFRVLSTITWRAGKVVGKEEIAEHDMLLYRKERKKETREI